MWIDTVTRSELNGRQYMATRVGQSGTLALGRLQNAPFIPARTEKEGRLFKPSDVYFSSKDGNDELFRTAFTFIDFGDKANVFLKYCGVRSEPSVKGEQAASSR